MANSLEEGSALSGEDRAKAFIPNTFEVGVDTLRQNTKKALGTASRGRTASSTAPSLEEILAMPKEDRAKAFIPNTFVIDRTLKPYHIAVLNEFQLQAFSNGWGYEKKPSVKKLTAQFDANRGEILGKKPKPKDLFLHLAEAAIFTSNPEDLGSTVIVPALDVRHHIDDPKLAAALKNVREGMIAALREIVGKMGTPPRIIVMAQTPWEEPGESTGWQTTDQEGIEICLTLVQEELDPQANDMGSGGLEEWNVYLRPAQNMIAVK